MYYVSYAALIVVASTVVNAVGIMMILGYSIPLHLGLYAFITFIIGIYTSIGKGTKGLTYAYLHLTVIWSIFMIIGKVTLLYLVIAQLYLTITYYFTNYIL